MIERVRPVTLRKTLDIVEKMKIAGIGFVPIPYFNEEEGRRLWLLADQKIQEMEKLAAEDNKNETL